MTFQPGQSGNPAGRAVGSRNKKTLAAEEVLLDHAQELVEDLVKRAKAGEPAAMRLCMERILPVGRGRPLPIDLPPVRNTQDAYAAAAVVMAALKEGAISAREAVDLLRVVEGLARLTGTVDFIRRIARKEVARAAQTLGFEHFFAGSPGRPDDEGRTAEAPPTANGDGRHANGGNGIDHENNGIAHGDLSPDQGLGLQSVADSGPKDLTLPLVGRVGDAREAGGAGVGVEQTAHALADGGLQQPPPPRSPALRSGERPSPQGGG